ncbi:hypothetical protein [Cytobacillus sp. IB215316]|uniref:hypothetical protein n=1 Tax=Cytobacillus sp. IB215316 TaxID=3097354 RepID=UPI002A0C9BCD|nr:hypothetical protein [Cytobacillus sp. IB215316]MDX8359699.1 hypothetical protein [Cytobacillus sp. IB215316]
MKRKLMITSIFITTFIYGCSSEQSGRIASLEKQISELQTQNEQQQQDMVTYKDQIIKLEKSLVNEENRFNEFKDYDYKSRHIFYYLKTKQYEKMKDTYNTQFIVEEEQIIFDEEDQYQKIPLDIIENNYPIILISANPFYKELDGKDVSGYEIIYYVYNYEKETTHELAVQFEDKKFKTIYSGLE